jgi:hypothetical protein
MTQRINKEMLRSRMIWVADLSRLELELSHNSYGWTLYQVDRVGGKILHEIAFAENTRCAYQILKGMYELLTRMEGRT